MPPPDLSTPVAGSTVTMRVTTPLGPITVVGTVLAADADIWTIRRRDGSTQDIHTSDITARRDVPPTPSRRASTLEVAQVAAMGWRALETARLGDWLLRASDGFTARANSALAIGEPGQPLDSAVETVIRWYDERRLPPRLQIVEGASPAALPGLLEQAGWTRSPAVHVMTAEVSHVLRAAAGLPTREVRLDDAPDDAWFSAYRMDAGELPGVARQVLTNHPSVVFASVREGERAVAIARATQDGRWAGLTAVEVAPDRRRQGLGRLVSAAAVREAGRRGARQVHLQVQVDNLPAVATYDRLGFTTHHDYRYATLVR